MEKNLPAWALEAVANGDRARAEQAFRKGTLQTKWPERKAIRVWAEEQGWPTPWFGFEDHFIKIMLESDESFAQALEGSGIEMHVPVSHYRLSDEKLQEFDALYEERSEDGHPTDWGILVGVLRGVRRAIEADVVVEIEGKKLKRVGSFLTWAHQRYHMLEDGYDSWIGDDKS